jgi:hypothetical protein
MSLSFTSPSSLPAWEILEIISLVIVWVGVFGEYKAERMKSPYNPTNFPPLESAKKKTEARFGRILVTGLALELVASIFVLTISNKEIAGLRQETEALRHDNELLVKTFQSRRITTQQQRDFNSFVENMPKVPVKVFMGLYDSETINFGLQVRRLLDESGYGTGKSNDIISIGRVAWAHNIGTSVPFAPLKIVFIGNPNETNIVGGLIFASHTNGTGYVAFRGHTNDLTNIFRAPAVINEAFNRIGMTPSMVITNNFYDQLTHPGDWGLFIVEKGL